MIIHHTAQNSCLQTLRTFTLPRTQVSAHYVICKDGTVYQMLNDYLRAWHAGVSKWGNVSDINSASIGIELDNNGFEPFTEPQMQNLLVVLDTLKKRIIFLSEILSGMVILHRQGKMILMCVSPGSNWRTEDLDIGMMIQLVLLFRRILIICRL